MNALLDIRDLHIALPEGSQRPYAVEAADLQLAPNEILCVVGESGSGKSLTARALMGLLPKPHVRVAKGAIDFLGEDLTAVSDARLRQIRGSEISMIFQEPMTALNPVMTIGRQIDEVFRFHAKMPGRERRDRALALLADVHLPNPAQIVRAYPHELSGGQRQRAMIAMALALDPKILIADEPTTALDVTTQAQILKLIKEMQAAHNTGVLFITHDFGVVADIADRVAVMQNGLVVETGPAAEVLNAPQHAYTKSLMAAVPSLTPRPARPRSEERVLEVKGLTKTYRGGGGFFGLGAPARIVKAAADVTLDLRRGETLGIVGESGSGKSTVARCIVRLNDADSGEILLDGVDLRPLARAAMRPHRAKIQMVFQDPYASLNPRTRVGRIIAQGPMIQGMDAAEAEAKARELLGIVGLDERAYDRFPHEFSGGQRQRIGVARALALEPEVLVADEPVSALDVSIQDQILKLLDEIRERMNLSMVFITHDLRVAAQVCDRLAVMRYGKVVEEGPTAAVFADPQDDYTKALLDAVPGKSWLPGATVAAQ
ncbi:ABC transporter ATP-binding protein [Pelagibius litoralis]|uniref:ABC transporter ATP-binding protein n=1 Tax=Pelagibius litoralis TaxID=374515 RepID=A0A967CAS5_9PROT|nr:ABC transporter ATP-binding protein [Pelagibius litoralis]NIA67873.1 ABC transporter ATP-binding protein [Pelagibius litoralis]